MLSLKLLNKPLMILSYTLPRAKENILAEIKIHTLRSDKANRWKPGYMIHHAINNRSPNYECFLKNKCKSVQQVLILELHDANKNPYLSVTIDRRRLSREEVETVAINDGFTNSKEMADWFFKDRKITMWAGKVIHWTDLKY